MPQMADETASTCADVCPYPISSDVGGSPSRPAHAPVDHTWAGGEPNPANPAATWSSCTRVRCQTSQLMGLASASSRTASWLASRPSTASATDSAIRPNASVSTPVTVMGQRIVRTRRDRIAHLPTFRRRMVTVAD